MKTQGLIEILAICHDPYGGDDKGFIEKRRTRRRKKGDSFFEGFCHYVVENKYRKNVSLRASHYINENKRLILILPLCI
jgi:hypothetical protein